MSDATPNYDEAIERGSPRRRAALKLATRHYFGRLWRDRRISIGALVFPALGNVFLFYLPPLVVASVIDRTLDQGDLDTAEFLPYVALFAALWATGELFWRIGIHFLNRTDGRGIESLYVDGMGELLDKDLAFFHDNFGGSLTKRVVGYAKRYEEFVDTLAFQVVGNLLPLVVAGAVLWRFDPVLVVALLGMIVLTALLVVPLIRRRQRLVDEREAMSAIVAGHVADTITNMDAVRAHAAEPSELAAHRHNVAEYRRLAIRSWDYQNLRIDGLAAPMSVITNALGLFLALSLTGGNGVEAVFVTFAYFTQATRILFEFNQMYRSIESSLTEAAQFTELLLEPPTILDPDPPALLAVAEAGVTFEAVEFHYPVSGGVPLFDGLDLTIAGGEKVGFVGRSGGGKSTLTRLLLRLLDIDAGRILVGGQDITTLRQRDLRSLIAYVPQDPVLFHRSLRDNIAFGRPGAGDDEILAAAQAAHAMEFIDALPAGFDTLVGERGVKLSGGQRQRIAIARAILRDAPILVLDEATSALDSESEALIQDALLRLMADRTALVVAHRLSTVQRMDRLVVLDRGRVVEQGTHAELLQLEGVYSGLWRRQSGGFLADGGGTASAEVGAAVR